MSSPENVTVTFDGRDVSVPKGTPLVLAAAQAGIEIPIFCYEPRLGPPIGACRMCLVEIEGMPKLQTACTMVATDGMVVSSRSERAQEGQDAVLEFILLNHPLDCPVCDKGGECPLQDLTFRYGPPNTRMTLPKRTYEKPLPMSPAIVLDRERCILCYRCTRFSSDVAEDGELVARERGARTVIATFQEGDYTNAFSGNVTELCPVGALLPTTYRHKARPWEILNIPTICQLCPTGCNTWVSMRENLAERVLSRAHGDVDGGWLCDRGRFADRVAGTHRLFSPLIRGEAGLEEVEWPEALRVVAQRLRHVTSLYGPGSVAVVTNGDITNEAAFGWALVAEELDARTAASPIGYAGAWERLDPYAARLADLEDADLVVVVGDAEPLDRAGIVDLRIRQARRNGAHLAIVGPGGSGLEIDAGSHVQTHPGSAVPALHAIGEAVRQRSGETVRQRPGTQAPRDGELFGPERVAGVAGAAPEAVAALAERLVTARKPVLVVTDPINLEWVENLAWTLSLDVREGGVLPLPSGPNERGARQAGLAGGGDEVLAALEAGDVRGVVLLGVDPIEEWPDGARWQMALASAEVVVTAAPYPNTVVSWSHVVLPAAVDLEREGTTTNLEGRVQRMRRVVEPPSRVDEVAAVAAVAHHLRVSLPETAPHAFVALTKGRAAFAGLRWSELSGKAPLPARERRPAGDPPWPALIAAPPGSTGDGPPAVAGADAPATSGNGNGNGSGPPPAEAMFHLVAARSLFAGTAVDRTPALAHQREGWVQMAFMDAVRLGLVDGDPVTVRHATGEHHGRLRTSRRLRQGTVRINWRGAPTGTGARVVTEVAARA